jgi:hypothetical protein
VGEAAGPGARPRHPAGPTGRLPGRRPLPLRRGRDYCNPSTRHIIRLAASFVSPALLILIFPLGFRATCYYYRKAYYRVFFADPVECAVGEVAKGYCGELSSRSSEPAPLSFMPQSSSSSSSVRRRQGVHDHGAFGIGGGSLAILASTSLLTFYTLVSPLRHIVGGKPTASRARWPAARVSRPGPW